MTKTSYRIDSEIEKTRKDAEWWKDQGLDSVASSMMRRVHRISKKQAQGYDFVYYVGPTNRAVYH